MKQKKKNNGTKGKFRTETVTNHRSSSSGHFLARDGTTRERNEVDIWMFDTATQAKDE
jgi:hypothetical protein